MSVTECSCVHLRILHLFGSTLCFFSLRGGGVSRLRLEHIGLSVIQNDCKNILLVHSLCWVHSLFCTPYVGSERKSFTLLHRYKSSTIPVAQNAYSNFRICTVQKSFCREDFLCFCSPRLDLFDKIEKQQH